MTPALAGFWEMTSAVAWTFEGERPARMRSAGLCFATSETKVAPRPPWVTPVVRTILPAIEAALSAAMVLARAFWRFQGSGEEEDMLSLVDVSLFLK